jgi:2-hydroxy-3-oxopropionate reductase
MLKIAYVGLGLMGAPMARNLMKAGFPVVAYNRSQAIVGQLAAEGAIAAESLAEAINQADVICTNLPDSPDVEQVTLGEGGVLAHGKPGQLFIDFSTIKPESARKIAQGLATRGLDALDAPVSGGQVGAQNGTLVFMVGGAAAAFEKAIPLFQAMGKSWILVGEAGAGQIAKAANQIMVAAQMAAMAELLVFALKTGVDPFKVVEAIKGGAAQCWTLDQKPPRLQEGIRTPGFKARMQLKDLNIVMETAAAYGMEMPLSSITQGMFQEMIDAGEGELDNAAVLSVLERAAGVRVGKHP